MAPSSLESDRSIRVNLTLPVTRLGFGPFSFDPIEQVIGCPVAELLESLMTGPSYRRPSAAGPAVEVYPLALPPGEGATVPLGQWGEVGFANHDGLLELIVPLGVAGWLRDKLGTALVAGPDVTCRRSPGMRPRGPIPLTLTAAPLTI